ncbi:ABC transporter substrate-binding protein [Vibrio ostreae]|uniref:ABC transporter substrate-binding protein n=1 Tax=Vibrio ostreae TaxID=2841925 RepID=A0A975U8U1_9VIBR|nr:ABC transporter substrate-binding protein [Vibrio ostreae]QXO16019.1 ABC transporter substrate-binding protein [Vibrio ostreae]
MTISAFKFIRIDFLLLISVLFSTSLFGEEKHTLLSSSLQEDERFVVWGVANYDALAPLLLSFQHQFPNVTIQYNEYNTNELYSKVSHLHPGSLEIPDLVMSSAMELQFKLVNDGYAQPYDSPQTLALPDWAKWHNEVFGFTFEPIVMVINTDILGSEKLPRSREQLLSLIRAKGPLVDRKIGLNDVEKVGLGYLTWFHDSQQSRTYGRLLETFGTHHAQLYPNSSSILNALLKGEIFIAYNLVGSYAFEWSAQHPWIETIMPTDYTSVIMRTAFIYRYARNLEFAQQFLDYLISEEGQSQMAKHSSLIPLSETAEGKNSRAILQRKPHGIFRAIPFGLETLVQTDQAKKQLLLKEWSNAMNKSVKK